MGNTFYNPELCTSRGGSNPSRGHLRKKESHFIYHKNSFDLVPGKGTKVKVKAENKKNSNIKRKERRSCQRSVGSSLALFSTGHAKVISIRSSIIRQFSFEERNIEKTNFREQTWEPLSPQQSTKTSLQVTSPSQQTSQQTSQITSPSKQSVPTSQSQGTKTFPNTNMNAFQQSHLEKPSWEWDWKLQNMGGSQKSLKSPLQIKPPPPFKPDPANKNNDKDKDKDKDKEALKPDEDRKEQEQEQEDMKTISVKSDDIHDIPDRLESPKPGGRMLGNPQSVLSESVLSDDSSASVSVDKKEEFFKSAKAISKKIWKGLNKSLEKLTYKIPDESEETDASYVKKGAFYRPMMYPKRNDKKNFPNEVKKVNTVRRLLTYKYPVRPRHRRGGDKNDTRSP